MGLLDGLLKKKKRKYESIDAGRYDWGNVYDVCAALGCLAGCVGEASVGAHMQDKDESKGWEAGIIVSLHVFTDGPYGVIELNGMDDYRRMNVPDEIARFLLDSPFGLDSQGVFSFEPKLDNPCPVAAGIADDLAKAFEKGCKMSSQVQLNLHRYSVEVGADRRYAGLKVGSLAR